MVAFPGALREAGLCRAGEGKAGLEASEEYGSSVSNQTVVSKMLEQNYSWNCKERSTAFKKFYSKLSRTLEGTFSRCPPNLRVECYSHNIFLM